MRQTGLWLIGFWLVGLMGCSADTEKTVSPEDDQSAYVMYTFERFSDGCASDSSLCASFTAHYPVLRGESPAITAINQIIRDRVKESMGAIDPDMDWSQISLEQLCSQFFADYERLLREQDFDPMPWTLETKGTVIYQNDQWLTVALRSYQFTGGAHSNTYTALLNFDRETGRELYWDDVLQDSLGFVQLAEDQFRQARNIGSNVTLDQAGFFWGEDFQPPVNFALTQTGLRLFYNNYEIAPYVLGPTDFVVPYHELTQVLQPRYLLASEASSK